MKQGVAGQRNKRGFTMMELLSVVAIMAILAAVAFPAVAQIQKRLEIAKLDETARQIFLAAQNELTGLKASGRLEGFAAALKGSKVEQRPSDYPREDESWKDLYAVSAQSAPARDYLLRTGSALRDAAGGGDFLLELNPNTGDVYGAFYANTPIVYDEVQTTCAADRQRSTRQSALLGYYGGSMGDSGAVGLPQTFSPKLTIVNGEELYVTVTCDELLALRGTREKLQLDVTAADESGHLWTKSWRGGTVEMPVNSDKTSVSLVLDSLNPDLSFAKVTGGTLTPGDNLTLTATMTYAHRDIHITGSATGQTNSLFAAREGQDIAVSRVRHLNNLRAALYPAAVSGATITQSQAIDFDFKKWDKADYLTLTNNPLQTFAPIENEKLLTRVTYNGGNNPIVGFPIAGEDNVGLFAAVKSGSLHHMRLVDFAVSGSGNHVGALAGQITDTTVEDCGVYLNTLDDAGRFLPDLPQRLTQYTVKGKTYVGGLVGQALGNTALRDSFAAISVTAVDCAGGLLGGYENKAFMKAVVNCYASGGVAANPTTGRAGGLVGTVSNGGLSNCYSTSDVTAAKAGGLVAVAANALLQDCKVYGRVEAPIAGALVGDGSARYQGSCRFLIQAGYNEALSRPAGVTATDYDALKAVPPNGKENSHPYHSSLAKSAFPFPLLKTLPGMLMPHYGSWPVQLRLQTSLVYYERYEDGAYGYYARTSLTAEGVEQAANTWVVDTLKKQLCVEDGYALLTTAALSQFRYSRNGGAEQTVAVSPTVNRDAATQLEKNVNLVFKNADTNSTHTIAGASVYRLPYLLQTTGHTAAGDQFYDRLKVTIPKDETPYTFYYCADFGKNAVNPDINATVSTYPDDPGGAERPVYVRSARQLNLLGRTTYYWSQSNSSYNFYFLQETEIDFGKYTSNYCGEPFDMMNTAEENPHRNLPIGQTGRTLAKQFNSTYDGGGNPIVDFRCVTYPGDNYQFTGLFGEVHQATLKNIVMTASHPEEKSAYVESRYSATGYYPGVGALAGLIYEEPGDAPGSLATVTNCAVSGFTVQYAASSMPPCAIGGLTGFNFGAISNSSAVSVLVSGQSNLSTYVGGLTGSLNGRGSITRCYAGGALAVGGGIRKVVGGVSGGFANTFGFGSLDGINGRRDSRITDSYSFCVLSSKNIPLNTANVFGVSEPNKSLTITNTAYLLDAVEPTLSPASGVQAKTEAELTAWSFSGSGRAAGKNTYPWSARLQGKAYPFPSVLTRGGEAVHYGDWHSIARTGDSAWVAYYEQYEGGAYGWYGLRGDKSVVNSLSTDKRKILAAGYGVFSENGKDFALKQHDWDAAYTAGETTVQSAPIAEMRDRGILYRLYPFNSEWLEKFRSANATPCLETSFRCVGASGKETEFPLYINTSFAGAILPDRTGGTTDRPFQIRTQQQLQEINRYPAAWSYLQTYDVTVTSSDIGQLEGTSRLRYDGGNYAIVGLRNPLFLENNGVLTNIRLTESDISGNGNMAALSLKNSGSITNCSATGNVTSQGWSVAGLVYENSGSITNCYFHGTAQGRKEAFGFLAAGKGNINGCYASGTIRAETGYAAAFVGTQSGGTIQNCYAVGAVTAEAGSVSGFKWDGGGALVNCYTVATTETPKNRAWYPLTQNKKETPSNCYWATDVSHVGKKQTAQLELGKTMAELRNPAMLTQLGAAFAAALPENSHPDSKRLENTAYPYPKLAALDHYGDWPAGGRIGAYRIRTNGTIVGCSLDVDTGAVTPYGGTSSLSGGYGILYDESILENKASWKVRYDVKKYNIGDRILLQNAVSEAGGLITQPFNPQFFWETVEVTFTNNQTKFVFIYSPTEDTFTYIPH